MPPISKTSSFLSDDDTAVDALVVACLRKDPTGPLVQRKLQPFFMDAASEQLSAKNAELKLARSGRKNNRSGSPTSSSDEAAKTSRPAKTAKMPLSVPPTAKLEPVKATSACAALVAVKPNNLLPSPITAFNAALILAACPAIFKSPKPSDVPMPSSHLLRRLTSSDIVSGVPMALPIMAAA